MLTGNAGLFLRFILSAAIGAGGALGVGALTAQSALRSAAGVGQPDAYTLTGAGGGTLDFTLKSPESSPVPLKPLPPTATIQLTSYTTINSTVATNLRQGIGRAPWWNAAVPRVPPITQFDGGPLQAYNCTMAAGAMLARLGYGIVSSGSQLRALQDVQTGGTTLDNLETAVGRGWNVQFFQGALTALQLRALLFAGAGAVVQGQYAQIPVGLRLQKDFTEGHAIYLDAFRQAGPDGPAAYYVIDPIGHPWEGYKGDWWPADVVESFGTSFGGGQIYTAWAFAGGLVPVHHPILPPSAYPGAGGPFSSIPPASTVPSGAPSPSAGSSTSPTTPSAAPSAAASAAPTFGLVDPMPPGTVPGGGGTPAGTTPPFTPTLPPVNFESNASEIAPLFVHCIVQPPPSDCPAGIIGIVNPAGSPAPTSPLPPLTSINLLYANPLGPGMYEIVFQAPPNTAPEFWLWPSTPGSGTLEQAAIEPAILNGDEVSVATITIDPNANYSFVATATGDGIRAVSPVGSLSVGQ